MPRHSRNERLPYTLLGDKHALYASVLQYAAAHDRDRLHYRTVARLSCALFDGFLPLHGHSESERFLLECGALLHDIGHSFGSRKHNTNAYSMIVRTPYLSLFDKRSRFILGLLARYHRKKDMPHPAHEGFSLLVDLDRRLVTQLAALLRIADGLDASHTAAVAAVESFVDGDTAVVHVFSPFQVTRELTKAREKADLFEQVFQKRFLVQSITI